MEIRKSGSSRYVICLDTPSNSGAETRFSLAVNTHGQMTKPHVEVSEQALFELVAAALPHIHGVDFVAAAPDMRDTMSQLLRMFDEIVKYPGESPKGCGHVFRQLLKERAVRGQTNPSEERILIGLNLSTCIADILEGKISLSSVAKIITGTKVSDPEGWPNIIASYQRSYWKKDPEGGERIFRRLLEEGKIIQPRLIDGQLPSTVESHWVTSESEINYVQEVQPGSTE